MTIEQQLKALKTSLNPTSDTTESIRNTLTKRAHFLSSVSHVQSVPLSMRLGVWQTYRFTFVHIRQVASVAFIILLSGGGTFMAKASLAAVPGDTLYPIKRNLLEKVELVLAPTAQDEANVYLKHVATRLDEIRVLNSRDIPAEEKTQHINQTVLALNRDLTSARQSLQIAAKDSNKDSGSTAAVVAVAKSMTQSTSDVKVALASAQGTNKELNNELSKSVNEVIITAEQAGSNSLSILIENQSGAVEEEEVLNKFVGEALVKSQQRLDEMVKAVTLSEQPRIDTKIRQALYDAKRFRLTTPLELNELNTAQSDIRKVRLFLKEANYYLDLKNFKKAYYWNTQTKATLDSIAVVIKQASDLINESLLPESIISTTTPLLTTSTSPTTTTTVSADKKPVVQVEVEEVNETTVSSFKK